MVGFDRLTVPADSSDSGGPGPTRDSGAHTYDGLVLRRPPVVYLHVGPPKSGTTYLQEVLWRNPRRLAEQGVSFPRRPIDHFRAALDLRELDFAGHHDPQTDGAWNRFSAEVRGSESPKVVISHEVLAAATSAQVQRAVESLAPAEVHIVYCARDIARQLPAVWQESLKNRRTRRYRRFLKGVLGSRADRSSTKGFWARQDPLLVLERWGEHVPPERMHVVTLPQRSAGQNVLWQRFCAALAIEPDGFELEVSRSNPSLTQPAAEVLRRLNSALPESLTWPQYERLVKSRFNRLADRGVSGERLRVPPQWRRAVRLDAERIRSGLAASEYDVVGDLDDLVPSDDAFGPVRELKAAPVANAAVTLLAAVLAEQEAAAARKAPALRDLTQRRHRLGPLASRLPRPRRRTSP